MFFPVDFLGVAPSLFFSVGRSEINKKGEYQSGQMGQTVNLLSYDFGGSNPSSPTNCGSSSVDRASAFQAEGRGFESRFPLNKNANVAQR